MRMRRLGRTGLMVSEVVLGGGYTGGILILRPHAEREEALKITIESGINWIDTAPLYGNGESETTVGRYLHHLSPRPSLSTKVSLEPEDLRDVEGAIRRSLDRSLARLRTSRIDLLQLHNPLGSGGPQFPLSLDFVLGKNGVAETFAKLKNEGMILACGITALGDSAACREAIESQAFDTAQIYYNMINPSAGWNSAPSGWSFQDFSGLLDSCARHDIGVFAIRIFAGGALASSKKHGREFVLDLRSTQMLEDACAGGLRKELGIGPDESASVALRFVLAHPHISCAIVGVADIEQLQTSINAARQTPLSGSDISAIRRFHFDGGQGHDSHRASS